MSSPILRCRSATNRSESSPGLLPDSNNSGMRSRRTVFHWLTCTGCTECSRAICATVLTPSMASMATVALNAALCLFRFAFVFMGLIDSSLSRPPKP